ncbi:MULTISPECIES: LysR substrate-binding domain-containing protein [unclassified Pannonibacter]|uniref:LysR substrate-binding domain-containing protein n=1 Tax=unclassified Pannonibacter TaxID=2627228 RepID=UPI00164673B0|nr:MULTISPECIES: LysR substrate-binding domain-containing protein [unclassified Pannonibacter]
MKQPVSLVALRTFLEVARLGSMKEAASSLGVTAGAVSQQVRQIEQRLRTRLFHRSNRDVRLTEQGHRLFSSLNNPFREIEDAVAGFHFDKPRNQCLVVSTVPSFAACWLVPRLGRFSALYPGIEVRIETSVGLVDLRRGGVDVAIRHGSGEYHGVDITHLVTPNLIAICNPSYAQEHGAIDTPRDYLDYTLLQDRNRSDWRTWFRAHHVDDQDHRVTRGPSFADDALLIEAVAEGLGLAVVRDIYAQRALSKGQVVMLTERKLETKQAYFFLSTPDLANAPRVRAFRNWLQGEIRQMEKEPGHHSFTPMES